MPLFSFRNRRGRLVALFAMAVGVMGTLHVMRQRRLDAEAIQSLESQGFLLGRMDSSETVLGRWLNRFHVQLPVDGPVSSCYGRANSVLTDLSRIERFSFLTDFHFTPEPTVPVTLSDQLMTPLARLTSLETVYLNCDTELSDDFLRGLSRSANLRSLHISSSSFTDEGIGSLAACKKLEYLTLAHCRLRRGLCGLSLGTLESLDVSFTDLDSIGVRCLKTATQLTRLRLSGTAIGDDDLDVLAGLPKLESLEISDSAISDAGLLRLERSASPSLFLIAVIDTAVSLECAVDFTRRHPSIVVVLGSHDARRFAKAGTIVERAQDLPRDP